MRDETPILFRRFQPTDARAVRELHELALRASGAFIESEVARCWDRDLDDIDATYLNPGGEFIVGVIGERIMAMGGLLLDGDGVAVIKRMRVHPEVQGRGVGRALLHRLEHHARAIGVRRVLLDTLPVQGPALALYQSSGYVETHRATRDGVETVFMEKRLQ